MERAVKLARRGLYTTSPNPRVGCVIVRNGIMVGEGFHRQAGEGHAEVNALRMAAEKAQGATCYVTLEPCSHFGRTPPCADSLIEAGVGRVFVGMQDPNPQVAGRGIARLREAGIEVEVGLLEAECQALNPGFIKRMTQGQPWVRVKTAASIDGRTALANGASQWITGAAARADVQAWRARSCAVLSSSATVLADDAALNVRQSQLPESIQHRYPLDVIRQPLRVILDRQGLLTGQERLFSQPGPILLLVDEQHAGPQGLENVQVRPLATTEQGFVLTDVLNLLAELGVNEILVEAGATLAGALMQQQLVDEWVVYLAPALMGPQAQGMLQLPEFTSMSDIPRLQWQDMERVGEDIRLTLRMQPLQEA